MKLNNVIPILRIFDEAKAKEFYIKFLEFKNDWEHRFEDGFPLYMQISKDDCIIHLSEHHGDCCPGAAIKINTKDIENFQNKLKDKDYKYSHPGIEKKPWGTKEMVIVDPFGNRITFSEIIEP
ncbi:MAG: glyoxalase/bleomycin resistance/extradiol dioxygenase family protein [Planctomycetota bacterium]|nr:MAG: glyoxalase/bleomycin resistance/extradiol dioxygenase family protein [Planctomycetota bacterium]